MKIEQLYTSCLAQGAYYIESNGEIAIIDPVTKRQVPEGERGEVCIKGAMIMKGYNNLPVRNF